MKVMHVETGRHLYGGALQVYYLMRALKQRHQVENVLVCPEQSDIGQQASDVATIEACTMRGDLDLMFTSRLVSLINKHKPNILHIHSRRGADIWGAFAAAHTRAPAILTRRVDNAEPGFFARFKARKYQKVVAISEGIRTVVLKAGIPKDHVVTIHSAVDTERFTQKTPDDNVRARFGFDKDHIVVAIVAQLIERKGHKYLFDIIPQLLQQRDNIRILVLGKGPEEEALKNYVNELKINKAVHFAGFQEDIEHILPSIDVVVHPALKEGLGVSLLQASACGVPIVASAVGGIPEIVRDSVNGFLIPPQNSEAILEKLSQLISDPTLRQQQGEAGRKIIENEFSIDKMAAGNYRLYETIVKPV